MTKNLCFPPELEDTPASKFIERLLNKTDVPAMRSGCRKGPLKSEPWLAEINWDEVACKRMTPPLIPPNDIARAKVEKCIRKAIPAPKQLEKFYDVKEAMLDPEPGQEHWDANF